mmetsp:Transcript_14299/g.36522  ORF Transcript_14299/g.36522 Transcript_14299/m.36522 type:complete len:749 (+) Transcript_14299:659-2905(+)
MLEGVGRVEHGENLVADELEERPLVLMDDVRDPAEGVREQVEHLLRREVAADVLEPIDIHKEDGGVALGNTDRRLDAGLVQTLHHTGRHVHGPGPDGSAHALEGRLQVLQFLGNLDRLRLLHGQLGLEVDELQARHGHHVVDQRAQRLQQVPREHVDLHVQDVHEDQQQHDDQDNREEPPQRRTVGLRGAVHQRGAVVRGAGFAAARPAGLHHLADAHVGCLHDGRDPIPDIYGVRDMQTATILPVRAAIQIQEHHLVRDFGKAVDVDLHVVAKVFCHRRPSSPELVLSCGDERQLREALDDAAINDVGLEDCHGQDQDQDAGAHLQRSAVAELLRQRPHSSFLLHIRQMELDEVLAQRCADHDLAELVEVQAAALLVLGVRRHLGQQHRVGAEQLEPGVLHHVRALLHGCQVEDLQVEAGDEAVAVGVEEEKHAPQPPHEDALGKDQVLFPQQAHQSWDELRHARDPHDSGQAHHTRAAGHPREPRLRLVEPAAVAEEPGVPEDAKEGDDVQDKGQRQVVPVVRPDEEDELDKEEHEDHRVDNREGLILRAGAKASHHVGAEERVAGEEQEKASEDSVADDSQRCEPKVAHEAGHRVGRYEARGRDGRLDALARIRREDVFHHATEGQMLLLNLIPVDTKFEDGLHHAPLAEDAVLRLRAQHLRELAAGLPPGVGGRERDVTDLGARPSLVTVIRVAVLRRRLDHARLRSVGLLFIFEAVHLEAKRLQALLNVLWTILPAIRCAQRL